MTPDTLAWVIVWGYIAGTVFGSATRWWMNYMGPISITFFHVEIWFARALFAVAVLALLL